ncbi:transmembrane protein, putative [Bodo saltans]|uniref:Transmembrane protein, putative n=1 Tax=Bodo saltans TaxID=75058 RepID=A0A0S4J3H2_BODSA|nr:transmembrane protein, putative [Bodo saltans]|eukprot:CUG68600.1 transmembrane protein, putative [Bodo saltans]
MSTRTIDDDHCHIVAATELPSAANPSTSPRVAFSTPVAPLPHKPLYCHIALVASQVIFSTTMTIVRSAFVDSNEVSPIVLVTLRLFLCLYAFTVVHYVRMYRRAALQSMKKSRVAFSPISEGTTKQLKHEATSPTSTAASSDDDFHNLDKGLLECAAFCWARAELQSTCWDLQVVLSTRTPLQLVPCNMPFRR